MRDICAAGFCPMVVEDFLTGAAAGLHRRYLRPFFFFFSVSFFYNATRIRGLELGGYCGMMYPVTCRDHGSCLQWRQVEKDEGHDNNTNWLFV